MVAPKKRPYTDPAVAPGTSADAIVIERREVIGVVELAEWGTQDPIKATFDILAGWLPNQLDHRGMNIEWTAFGQKWHLIIDDVETEQELKS